MAAVAHVEPAELAKLARKELTAEAEAAARQHVAECETCAVQYQEVLSRRFDSVTAGTATMEVGGPATPAPTDAGAPPHARSKESVVTQPMELPRGTTIGRYVVVQPIGQGGMGVVYLAYDPELDRRVAVKLLRPDRAAPPSSSNSGSESARQRLLREAQAMAKLSHPNVVTVFDTGVHGDNVFMAMEYVPGLTLAQWLRAEKRPWRQVLPLLVQAGRGLAAAHAAHLVHRDFKPSNVLLSDSDGRVRVTDFGLVRAEGSDVPIVVEGEDVALDSMSADITLSGAIVGTVGYMAPEQVRKEPLDGRADQFSFGVSLYEALYGQRPFAGDTASWVTSNLLKGKISEPPKDTPVPSWVHRIVLKALSPTPEQRFASMDALLDELEKDPSAKLRRAAPWAVGAAVVLAVFGGNAALQRSRASRCQGAGDGLASVWDSKVAQELEQAYESSKKPFAQAASAAVKKRLDAYAADWREAGRDACEAVHVRREQDEETLALRRGCLDERLRELNALAKALKSPDAVERSVTAAYGLSAVARCADVPALRRSPSAKGARVGGTERALLDDALLVRAMVESGQLAGAVERSKALLPKAQAQRLPQVVASASVQQGLALAQQGKFPDAEAALRDGVVAAEAAGLDDEAARGALQLAVVLGHNLHKPAEGRWFERLGEAALARLGGDPLLELQQRSTNAVLLAAEDKPQEAVAAHTRALEAAKQLWGETHPLVWRAYTDLATSLANVKDFRQAVPLYERALDVKLKAQGPEHPDVAFIRANLGNALFFVGEAERAFDAMQQALAVRERIFGADSPRLVPVLNNLADIETKAGKLEAAEQHATRAVALAQKAGPTHPLVFVTGATFAELELAQRKLDAAAQRLDALLALSPQPPATVRVAVLSVRALAALEAGQPQVADGHAQAAVALEGELGKDNADLLTPLVVAARAALALQKPEAAVAAAERAVAIAEKARPWVVLSADAKLALAEALDVAQPGSPRVKPLAQDAVEGYRNVFGRAGRLADAQRLVAR